MIFFNFNLIRQVRLIDTGKVLERDTECIYTYCGTNRKFIDLPPRCFECGLAKLQPSQIRYPNGHWPIEAIALFKRKIENTLIEIEVQFKYIRIFKIFSIQKKNAYVIEGI